jgi:1-acyl-sn-glycerol-3-phosphate acyltransferase
MKTPRGFFIPALFFRFNLFFVSPRVLQTLFWLPVSGFLRVFGGLNFEGRENIPKHKSGTIFASNHISKLDPFLVPATMNPLSSFMPMFYVSRERDFYEVEGPTKYLYGGLPFKLVGAHPVIPKNKNYAQMLAAHIGLLLAGKSIYIFPEGGLNRTRKLVRNGQPGVAYLLWATGCPVIPVAVHGHKGIRPRDFFLFQKKITVLYGKPITKEELFGTGDSAEPPTHDELIIAAEKIMARVRDLLVAHGVQESEDPQEVELSVKS